MWRLDGFYLDVLGRTNSNDYWFYYKQLTKG